MKIPNTTPEMDDSNIISGKNCQPSQAPSKAPSRAPSHRSNADAADAPAPAPGIKKSSSILGSLFKGKNK